MAKAKYLTAALTDAGGHSNEDSYLLRNYKSNILGIVSDGVGGLDSGDLASGFIRKSFDKWFDRNSYLFEKKPIQEIKNMLSNEITKVHENLLDIAQDKSENFGATLTLVFLKRWEYITAQVGDSRAYIITNNEFSQVTKDQTVKEYERTTGKIISNLPEERKEHTLMQCMGQKSIVPKFTEGILSKEYSLVICSDGMYNLLDNKEIEEVIRNDSLLPKDKLDKLKDMARERGENDNITEIYISRVLEKEGLNA